MTTEIDRRIEDHPEKTKVAAVFQILPAMEAAFDCKAQAALQPAKAAFM
jgi:hypothetical protein